MTSRNRAGSRGQEARSVGGHGTPRLTERQLRLCCVLDAVVHATNRQGPYRSGAGMVSKVLVQADAPGERS